MRRYAKTLTILTLGALLIFGWDINPWASAVTNNQLAFSNSGSQANIASDGLNVTPNGKYMVFSSGANYLVSGDSNGKKDVFIRDINAGTTSLVSVDSSGNQGDGDSTDPMITSNGRYVAFYSEADNLATIGTLPAGASYLGGVYLHDMKTGVTESIASSYYGWHGWSRISAYTRLMAISEDGRFVYYRQLDNDQTTPTTQLYVKDRLLNTTSLISKAEDNTEGDATTDIASSSCDGRFVALSSYADNLVANDTNGKRDIFLVDTMGTQKITDITINANDNSSDPRISCDGNFILFNSDASNLVTGDTNGKGDVFQYDVTQGTTKLISIDENGSMGGGTLASGSSTMSADGRYIGFTGYNSTSTYNEAYIRDTWNNTSKVVSLNSSSQYADYYSDFKAITSDGQQVIYISGADNLGVSNSGHDSYLFQVKNY